MTRRILWSMDDVEVYNLREKAHKLLTELYLEYEQWQAYAQGREEARNAWKPRTDEYKKLDFEQRQAWKRVAAIEARIVAQRSFCASLDNEYSHRHPPFWTRADLEAMDNGPYRRVLVEHGGVRGKGKRGGL